MGGAIFLRILVSSLLLLLKKVPNVTGGEGGIKGSTWREQTTGLNYLPKGYLRAMRRVCKPYLSDFIKFILEASLKYLTGIRIAWLFLQYHHSCNHQQELSRQRYRTECRWWFWPEFFQRCRQAKRRNNIYRLDAILQNHNHKPEIYKSKNNNQNFYRVI